VAIVTNAATFTEARDYLANKLLGLTFTNCTVEQKKFVNHWIEDYIDKNSGRVTNEATVGELYEIPRQNFIAYANTLGAQYPDTAAVAAKMFNKQPYELDEYSLKLCIHTSNQIKTFYSPTVTDGKVYQFLQDHPNSVLFGKVMGAREGTKLMSSWTENAKQSEVEPPAPPG